ncbi:hypothetical protein GCM10019815_17850 [Pediococcus damnosus]
MVSYEKEEKYIPKSHNGCCLGHDYYNGWFSSFNSFIIIKPIGLKKETPILSGVSFFVINYGLYVYRSILFPDITTKISKNLTKK